MSTKLTRLGYYLGVLSVIVLLWVGSTYIFAAEEADRLFGILTLMEGAFALMGLVVMDLLADNRIELKPESFERLDDMTFLHVGAIAGVLFVLQIIFGFTLMRARPIDKVLSIIFAAPAEELFFRGAIMTPLMDNKSKVANIDIKLGSVQLIDMDMNDFIAIMLSSIGFTFIHVNYYEFPILMVFVFFSGITLGFFYVKFENITANILAHLLLNVFVVLPTFYQIVF